MSAAFQRGMGVRAIEEEDLLDALAALFGEPEHDLHSEALIAMLTFHRARHPAALFPMYDAPYILILDTLVHYA